MTIIRHITLLWLLVILCGSCTDDDTTTADVSEDGAQISFVLSIIGDTQATRATWGDNDDQDPANNYVAEDGNVYEKRIDPQTVKVFLCKVNDSGTMDENQVIPVELLYWLDGTNNQYNFVGRVPSNTTSGNYKILVFANNNDETKGNDATKTEFVNLQTFSYDWDKVKTEEQPIPMFGFTTKALTFAKGERTNLGTIDMLRAMAKVEINIKDSPIWTIKEATLNRYKDGGYTVPNNYKTVTETKALDYENNGTYNPYGTTKSPLYGDEPLTFSQEGEQAWLYLPEISNRATGLKSYITLKLQNSKGVMMEETLYFRTYVDGSPKDKTDHNIVRNHIYRYDVKVDVKQLQISYQVLPWELVESKIGYAPKHASTDSNPFATDTDYENFIEGDYFILLSQASFSQTNSSDDSEKRNTVRKLFSYLYEDATRGDAETVYGAVYRPRFDGDNHRKLATGAGGATYFFMLTGPEGATWKAHLTNEDDFTFSHSSGDNFKDCVGYTKDGITYENYAAEGDVHKVSHGIARRKPYIIQINPRHLYTGTGFNENGDVVEGSYPTDLPGDDDPDKKWEPYYGDDYLTDWGKEKWYGQKVVDTEFYITVRLTDGTEYELTINPPYPSGVSNTLYKENRRYPGTDTRIWIRQLRAQYSWDYPHLSEDVSPTQTTGSDPLKRDIFQWWRVNPYWNPAPTTNTTSTE